MLADSTRSGPEHKKINMIFKESWDIYHIVSWPKFQKWYRNLLKNAELFDQRISNSKTSRVKIMHCAKFVMHVTQLIVSYIYNMLLSNTFTFRSVTSQYFTPNCIKKLNKSSINSQSFDFLPLLTDFSILCEFARHHAAKPLQRKIYMSCDVISRESMGLRFRKTNIPKISPLFRQQ